MIRLVFIFLLLILVMLALSWTHVLPGGWFLRDMVEDPALRAARLHKEHRQERLTLFAEESPIVGEFENPLVFLGSSTVEHYPLDQFFPGLEVINRGIGGESVEDCTARLDESLPKDVWSRVKGVVLYAGSINLRRGDKVPLIADRVRVLISKIQQLAPKSPVLLLGLVPGRLAESRASGALFENLNEGLRVLAEAMSIQFMPLAKPPLTTIQGQLKPEFSADDWHLNQAGYAVVTSWLKQAARGF